MAGCVEEDLVCGREGRIARPCAIVRAERDALSVLPKKSFEMAFQKRIHKLAGVPIDPSLPRSYTHLRKKNASPPPSERSVGSIHGSQGFPSVLAPYRARPQQARRAKRPKPGFWFSQVGYLSLRLLGLPIWGEGRGKALGGNPPPLPSLGNPTQPYSSLPESGFPVHDSIMPWLPTACVYNMTPWPVVFVWEI